MTQLAVQQHEFFDLITSPPTRLASHHSLLRTERATPQRQLEAYQRAYVARLMDCLHADYPLVGQVLGADAFDDLCRRYANHVPPETNSLNFYGRHFAAFLRSRVTPEFAWVCDLAVVEWALVEAIHADARDYLTPSAFGAWQPEQWSALCLNTSPSLRILTLNYDVAGCVQRLLNQETVAPPTQHQSFLAICRRGNDLWRLPLEPWSAILLQQLSRGVPLGKALAELSDDANATLTEASVFSTFARWLEAGVFGNAAPY